jgi:hypothetical protein
MTWNNTSPALSNSIAADIPDILENFQHTHTAAGAIDGAIVGSTIDNAVIGGTTPAAGTFTTLTAQSISLSAQPAFFARSSAEQANITPGSETTVAFGTEEFDLGSDFASNAFTARYTGAYQINVNVEVRNLDTNATSYTCVLKRPTNGDITSEIDPSRFSGDLDYFLFNISVCCKLTATEVVTVTVTQTGGVAQSDIGGNVRTNFSGYLVAVI